MDLHNYLIAGWYLICLVSLLPAVVRGYDEVKWWNPLLLVIAYPALVFSIATYGALSSWQAIVLMVWWVISTCTAFATVGKKIDMEGGTVFFAVLFTIVLGALGLTVPLG